MPTRLDWITSFRRLRRKPLYTMTVAVALGIGIAAATIVFSWFNGLFLHPLPGVRDSRSLQIFQLRRPDVEITAFSHPDYRDLATALDPSMNVAAYSMGRITIDSSGKPEQQWALFVSPNFFSVLGLEPAAGRLLDGASETVAVLSYDWWQTRFHADPAIIGQTIYINQRAVRIAGVGPPGFQGPYTGLALGIFLPVAASDAIEAGAARLENRNARWLTLMSRLKSGVTPEQASEMLRVAVRRLDSANPKGTFDQAVASLTPLWQSPVGAQAIMGPVMMALGGIVVVVVLLACSNAVGIMLIENTSRRKDMSIRLSLGAGSSGLIGSCLAEAAILSALAAGVGLVVTALAADHLQNLVPDIQFPVKLTFPVEGPVLGFGILAAAVTAIFCGLWTGLEARLQSAALSLRTEAANVSTSRERSRLRSIFIGVQIALSFLLLCSSALFNRSVNKARSIDLGFDTRGVSLVRIDLGGSRSRGADASLLLQKLLWRVAETPGLERAAFARSAPLGIGDQERVPVIPEGETEPRSVWTNRVSPGYFATLSTPVLAGRDFTDADRAGSAPVAIVNEALARSIWNSTSPLGRSFLLGTRRVQVVGVVRNTKVWSLTQESQPYLYLPLWQSESPFAVLFFKSRNASAAVARVIEGELQRLDPSVPVTTVRALSQQIETAMFPQRIALVILALFSLLGVYLTAVGLYGVIAHAAQSRTKEIAIRVALGATSSTVFGLVIRQGAALVAGGVAAGAALTLLLGRLLESVLIGSHGVDLASLAVTAALVAVVAMCATGIPALRAMWVEPVTALRAD